MNDNAILLPVMALAGWTFLVLLQIPFRRFRASFKRQVTEHDFSYGESARVPPEVSIPNRNYMNLLEAPVLFYVVCLVLYVSGVTIPGFLILAWSYVGLRVAHSAIHLTYNRVRHRLLPFALSNIVLITMWVLLSKALLS
jgi:hypothetical protein